MNLIELYNKIENPINITTVNKLIECFCKDDSFYESLTRASGSSKQSRPLKVDYDRVRNNRFAMWKKAMLSLTKEQAKELYTKGEIGKDFVRVRNFLKNHKDVNDDDEFDKLIYQSEELGEIYDKYRWDSTDTYGGWTYFCNKLITAHKSTGYKVEHRLYLNPNGDDTYKLAEIIADKFEKAGIPYFFKISNSPVRDDKIVVYTNTDLIEEHLKLLNSIKKEHPDLIARLNDPPILSGDMGFIGYGSEPLPENGKKRSFNQVRAKYIKKIISDKVCSWYSNNRNLKQGDCTLEDAFVKESTTMVLNRLKVRYNDRVDYLTTKAKQEGKKFDESTIKAVLGYDSTDLKSDELYLAISTAIRSKGVKSLYNGTLFYDNYEPIKIKFPSGYNYSVPMDALRDVVRSSIPEIMKFDKNFSKDILNTIKRDAYKVGIDPNKFCFDVDKVELFRKKSNVVNKETNGKLEFPTFDNLRGLASKYRVEYNQDSKKLSILDIKSNAEVTDPVLAQDALFANIWLTAAGIKVYQNDVRPGFSYAFNDGAEKTYNYFIKACTRSIEKTGDLNSLFVFKNASKADYKYAEDVIAKLFGNDYQTKFVDNYVQHRIASSLPKNKTAESLYDTEYAYRLLSEKEENNKSKK